MSYAGVESEYDYAERILRERDHARWEQSAEGIAAKVKREREDKERDLEWAKKSLEEHKKSVAECRKRIKRLERELSDA